MALPSKGRRRNPPDLTLRNLRAIRKTLADIVSHIKTLKRAGAARSR